MTSLTVHLKRPAGPPDLRTGRLLREELGFSLRDLWRSRIVFVFTFLFPLTWLVVLAAVFGNQTMGDTGVRLVQFLTPTAAVMGVLYSALPTVATTLAEAREQGVLKRVRGTPLPAWTYLTGRVGAAVVFALGSVTTMLLFGVVAYDVQIVWRTALATAVTMAVAIACLAACGLAVASLARSANVAQAASIAAAVVLGFLSGVLTLGDMPSWTDRLASVFPVKSFREAVQAQFDPFGSGAGWDVGALALMIAWGVGAGIIAVRAFRWDPAPSRRMRSTSAAEASSGRAAAADLEPSAPAGIVTATSTAVPAGTSWLRLLLAEVRWATRAALRDPGWVFFAVAMPVGLYAFMASAVPGGGAGPTGAAVHLEQAAGMIAWGAAVTGFVNMPEAIAVARDRGVLKRLRGTPLRPSLFLAGRNVSAIWIALLTGAFILALAVFAFDVDVAGAGIPVAAGMVLLGTTTLAASGFALVSVLPSSKAVSAVGLAILLPLGFFSDVFLMDGTPDWMSTVASWLPLKHLVNSVAVALDPGGELFSVTAVLVLSAWLVGAGLVAVRTFRWTARA